MSKEIKKEDEKQEKIKDDEKKARQQRLNTLYGAHGEINWRDELFIQYIKRDLGCMFEITKNINKGLYCKKFHSRHSLFRPKMTYPFETNIGRIHILELDKNSFEVFESGHRILDVFTRLNNGIHLGQIRWATNVNYFNFFPSTNFGISATTLKDLGYLCECLTKQEKKHPTRIMSIYELFTITALEWDKL